ncbi:MAG TPA: hypothetical protein VK446_08690 [Methylocystis sp.]|nr:hypothetical protein [Methylocystis sp.]
MVYLLNFGWPWFAAAATLGLVVGFLTATRGGAVAFSGRWILLAAVLLLAGAGIAAAQGVVPGRNGLLFEIGLLGSVAYFLGLPVGGGVKGLIPAPAPVAAKPTPVILRGAAPAAHDKPAPSKNAEKAPTQAKTLPGRPPPALPGPRDGRGDDLARIKGVGPKSVEKLHALGVYHFDQIAAWSIDEARYVGAALATPGRVERGRWIQQAREFAAAGEGKGETS